jgi:hypothetical protein
VERDAFIILEVSTKKSNETPFEVIENLSAASSQACYVEWQIWRKDGQKETQ